MQGWPGSAYSLSRCDCSISRPHEARPFRHLGTESVHVLVGRLVGVDDDVHELGAVDTVTYDCTLGPWRKNPFDEPAELIGITVPLGRWARPAPVS